MKSLHMLVQICGAGLLLLALWLVSVIFFVLPTHDAGRVPFWGLVAFLFAAYGIISLWFSQQSKVWLRWIVMIGSFAAALFGTFFIVANERHVQQGKDFEGYLLLMGLCVITAGVVNFFYALRKK